MLFVTSPVAGFPVTLHHHNDNGGWHSVSAVGVTAGAGWGGARAQAHMRLTGGLTPAFIYREADGPKANAAVWAVSASVNETAPYNINDVQYKSWALGTLFYFIDQENVGGSWHRRANLTEDNLATVNRVLDFANAAFLLEGLGVF
jgi:hypothetical protein